MGILATGMRALADGFDDHYYTSTRPMWSFAGVNVDAEGAMRISTVFACRKILAETIGSLPCITYRRRPDGGKERAQDHPLYDLLHDQPNGEQTAAEWFEQMTGWAAIRGSARSEIIPGPRGAVDELIPIHPDSITVGRVRGTFGSKLQYQVIEPDHKKRTLVSEQVFNLRGMSDDGISGMAPLSLARDTFGVALASERHAARTFGSAPRPAGTLEFPGHLSDDAYTRLTADLAAHAASGAQRALILEDGMKWNQIGMSNTDAEFLATRKFSVLEICRWFRIPPHMVADLESGASYASIEMMSLEFVIYTMLPWFRRWEQAIGRDLISAKGTYFAEFMLDGLLRGDTKSRFDAFAVARQWGWLSVNDIRRFENLNPIAGGDRYLEPLNMTSPTSATTPTGQRLLGMFAGDAAGRLVRKEITAMRKLGEADWSAGAAAFYAGHAAIVARELHIDPAEARIWCDRQRDELLADGPAALDRWDDRSDNLAQVALREIAT